MGGERGGIRQGLLVEDGWIVDYAGCLPVHAVDLTSYTAGRNGIEVLKRCYLMDMRNMLMLLCAR